MLQFISDHKYKLALGTLGIISLPFLYKHFKDKLLSFGASSLLDSTASGLIPTGKPVDPKEREQAQIVGSFMNLIKMKTGENVKYIISQMSTQFHCRLELNEIEALTNKEEPITLTKLIIKAFNEICIIRIVHFLDIIYYCVIAKASSFKA